MPRPERPIDPASGPVAEFAMYLRALRQAAGSPTYRCLAARAHYSYVTLSSAARGQELPTWAVTERFVEACLETLDREAVLADSVGSSRWSLRIWREHWEDANAAATSAAGVGTAGSHGPESAVDDPDAVPRWPDGRAVVEIVDSHELVGTALALAVQADGQDARYAPVHSAAGVLEHVQAGPPCQVLLELDLGRDHRGDRIDGVELIRPIVEHGNQVVVLSGSSDAGRIGAALDRGAFVWVPKNAPLPTLLAALREARAGRSIMPPGRRDQLIELYRTREQERREVEDRLDQLNQREHEILTHLASGMRAQAIADHYIVSLATVRSLIRAVLTKLEVSSQLEAVALYRRANGGSRTAGSRERR